MPYLILPQTNLLLTLIGSLDLSQPQYLSLKTRIKFPISGAHEKHFQSLIVAMYLTTIHSSNFKIFFSSYFQTSQAQTQNSNPFKHTAFRILHNQAAPQTSQTYVSPRIHFWYQPCQTPHCSPTPASTFLPTLFPLPACPLPTYPRRSLFLD